MGRLHTRYAPVRRSPPKQACSVLPLDLHVLSLSLAFILSQDQTLRCNYFYFLFFPFFTQDISDLQKLLDGWTFSSPLFISCTTIILSFSQRTLLFVALSTPSLACDFLVESGCKSTAVFFILQIFLQLFWKNFHLYLSRSFSDIFRSFSFRTHRSLSRLPATPRFFSKGLQRYALLSLPSKFFCNYF